MRKKFSFIAILIVSMQAMADEIHVPDQVETHVIDVGAGLCTVTLVPEDKPPRIDQRQSFDDVVKVLVYDAGADREDCAEAIRRISPDINNIDLLIISHEDYDHYHGAIEILKKYSVKRIWRTGYFRPLPTWEKLNIAIAKEVSKGAYVRDFNHAPVIPGELVPFGKAELTLFY